MEVLIFLIPMAIILGGFFIGACLWAIRKGQYDDLETPAHRILIDEQNIAENKPTTLSKGAQKS